ncbi:hypothetical protein PM3016_1472 [Paenibacillus mucilaginosus 3016]|uniref:Uncharacterized protein n=1 Tax=Paenibacillus mucilaginosus 3016 TaxID=1116391 RepID=H6NGV5_9BACL|nr:hypothetical protein [Paenibacillus mucilaginosus]AFC28397.1 hypothetical protein PM3016_1472 [Paenibacillus mucilaginosus 3016]WFA17196.1 hypothetical protein ERY13_07735 [Paenibacillus mucilaginosus]
MPAHSKSLYRDGAQLPAPQYFNPVTDSYEPLHGANGASDVNVKGSSAIKDGVLSVSAPGVRVQLPNIPCREVTVIARKNNIGTIYVGSETVSASSFAAELDKKDAITLPVSNASMLWIDASVAGEGISYVAL